MVSRRALDLLLRFPLRHGLIERPPVPVDDILAFLGLRLEFDDISTRFGVTGHLGCTIVETGQIFVDQSLDPMEHPDMEGRLNFTIIHEVAHVKLHGAILNPHLLPPDERFWLERQADWFAASLLMPRGLLEKEWRAITGHPGPLTIAPDMKEIAIANFGSTTACLAAIGDDYAAQLASSFKVSREAMRIQLQDLGSLPRLRR